MQTMKTEKSHPEYTYPTFTVRFLHDCTRDVNCSKCSDIYQTIRKLENEIDTLILRMQLYCGRKKKSI